MDTELAVSSLGPVLEGLIFTSGEEGLSVLQLQSVLDSLTRTEIAQALESLQEKFADPSSGIELVSYGGRYKFVSKEIAYPAASRLYAKEPSSSISPAAMEVLALVAYRGPITRVQIDEIRGVASDTMIRKLQARGLIETCGHLDAIGRPLLYQVTPAFLDCFGIESLEDLPACAPARQEGSLFDLPQEE